MDMDHITRRGFLTTSAGATLAGWAVSQSRAWGANERIGIGVIGCGGRGNYLMDELDKCAEEENAEVVAVCDVWKPNLEKAVERVKAKTSRTPQAFRRFHDLLSLPEVDAVFITTPDHAHSPILAAAARAKKHVYCEKPMANRLEDAIAAIDAVKENKVIVQIGTQRRSEGLHKAAAKLVQSGALGTVSEIDTAWHDSGPRWARPFADVRKEDVDWAQYLMDLPMREFDPRRYRCWHLYRDYTSGLPGLLGSHVIDLAMWYMDDPFPTHGVASGGIYVWKDGREHCDTIECLWEYPKGFLLRYSNRLGNDRHVPEVTVYGTHGTLDSDSKKVIPEGGGKDKIKEAIAIEPEPDDNHMANFLQSIRAGKTPNASIDNGYSHAVASILASEAQRLGKRLVYDSAKREIREG
jgi:predicted dehydrogenase